MRISKHSLRHHLRFQKITFSFEKWKLDWLWVEGEYREKKTHIFLKACRTCGQRVAKVVVNPAQANYSADFIKGSENIQKYMAFRHQAPSNTPSPTVNDNSHQS